MYEMPRNAIDLSVSYKLGKYMEVSAGIRDILAQNVVFKQFPKFYDDAGNIILSRRDLRLIRRISRDCIYRNSTIDNTLNMWPDVQHGEKEYLFPTSYSADHVINTFHSYEPALFKNLVLPLVLGLDPAHPHYGFALKIAAGLDKFVSIPTSDVPKNSLLREFF